MGEIIRFEVESLDLINSEDGQFSIVEMVVFSTGENHNGFYCSEEVLKNTTHTIYNKPIVYNFDNSLNDVFTHSLPEENRIAGFIVPNSGKIIDLKDGRKGLQVVGKIWKLYNKKLMQILKRDNGEKSISVELLLNEKRPFDKKRNIYEMVDFSYTGVCILGDFVSPAVDDAKLKVLAFQNYEQILTKFSKYSEINLEIPQEVKDTISKYKFMEKNPRSLSLVYSDYLCKQIFATPDKIKSLYNYFKKNNKKDINYYLRGGEACEKWVNQIYAKIKEIDKKGVLMKIEEVETFAIPKEEWGTGKKLEIDKSPESVSDKAWGEVDKVDLMWDILKAENYRELVKEVYLKVDEGWEDSPSQSLHYPVMEIRGDKVVYNRYGLSNALARAKQEEETEVVKKIENIYKKLGLLEEDKEEEKMSIHSDDSEKFEVEIEVELNPEKEDDAEESAEGESKEEGETSETEEMCNDEEVKMSLDAHADIKYFLDSLEDETYRTYFYNYLSGSYTEEALKAYEYLSSMFAKLQKENKELREFKAEKEREMFSFSVDKVLREIMEKTEIPSEEIDMLRDMSREYTLENFDAWANLAKAKAFNFAIKKNTETDEVIKYGLPANGKKVKSVWKKLQ
ncbi:MAG: hypothetical protein KatS3mg002_1060 [Candidatus Woesearchaeota archaeon]|jgi:hypothetical protein|nr:MAG: hypothetical protein KatS3mg002_1060 [Candidatus Woesearchaeota archaeon]